MIDTCARAAGEVSPQCLIKLDPTPEGVILTSPRHHHRCCSIDGVGYHTNRDATITKDGSLCRSQGERWYQFDLVLAHTCDPTLENSVSEMALKRKE